MYPNGFEKHAEAEKGFTAGSVVNTPVLLAALGTYEIIGASNAGAAMVFFGLAALAAMWTKTSASEITRVHDADYGF